MCGLERRSETWVVLRDETKSAKRGETGRRQAHHLVKSSLHRRLHLLDHSSPGKLDGGNSSLDSVERADGKQRFGVVFRSLDTLAGRE